MSHWWIILYKNDPINDLYNQLVLNRFQNEGTVMLPITADNSTHLYVCNFAQHFQTLSTEHQSFVF